MEKTALIVIDAQQEYFAPSGKIVHRTHLVSLSGFLADVTSSEEVMR